MFVLHDVLNNQKSLLQALAISSVILYAAYRLTFRPQRLPLPPGPTGLPVIGNVHQLPSSDQHAVFATWAKKYGPVTYLSVLGQPLVLLSSFDAAVDLLEKKSAIYSDRHQYCMVNDLVGWGNALVFLPFGDRFKKSRKLLQSSLNQRLLRQYRTHQEAEAHHYLAALLETPDKFEDHIRQDIGSVIAMVSYGYKSKPRNDPLLRLSHDALDHLSASGPPGKFLVDFITWLRFVPEWVPGANFKRLARAWKKDVDDMVNLPWTQVKHELSEGTARPSLAATLQHELVDNNDPIEEDISKWAVASLFGAGADTTISTLLTFILCMVLNPEVQAKAQAEIDAICGHDRLPGFEDRASLPYVEAIIKETFRWHPSVKLAPHRLMKEDICDNYRVPAGSVTILNTWAISRDEGQYSNPDKFNPERFMSKTPELDPRQYVFGFGRRVCPGLNLADSAIYIGVVTTLATFNISKRKDNFGADITPAVEYENGILSRPRPFPCSITPRSVHTVELIRNTVSRGNINL